MLQFVRQITEKSRPQSIGSGKAAIDTASCSPGNLRGSADFIDSSPGPVAVPGAAGGQLFFASPWPWRCSGSSPPWAQEGSLRSDPSGAAIQSKRTVIRKEVPGDISFHVETNRRSMTPLQRNLKQNTMGSCFQERALDAVFFHIVFV